MIDNQLEISDNLLLDMSSNWAFGGLFSTNTTLSFAFDVVSCDKYPNFSYMYLGAFQ